MSIEWLGKACWRKVAAHPVRRRRGEIDFLGSLVFACMVQQVEQDTGSVPAKSVEMLPSSKSVLQAVALALAIGKDTRRLGCSRPCELPVCELYMSSALSRRHTVDVLVLLAKARRPALTDDT